MQHSTVRTGVPHSALHNQDRLFENNQVAQLLPATAQCAQRSTVLTGAPAWCPPQPGPALRRRPGDAAPTGHCTLHIARQLQARQLHGFTHLGSCEVSSTTRTCLSGTSRWQHAERLPGGKALQLARTNTRSPSASHTSTESTRNTLVARPRMCSAHTKVVTMQAQSRLHASSTSAQAAV